MKLNKSLNVFIILLVSSALFLSSCKKHEEFEGEYELTGRVIDGSAKKPIPFAIVEVLQSSHDDWSGWASKTILVDRCDAKGNFKLKFNVEKGRHSYKLTAQDRDYYPVMSPPYIEIGEKGNSEMDIKLTPYAFITLHIKGNQGGNRLIIGHGGEYRAGVDTLVSFSGVPFYPKSFNYVVLDRLDPITGKEAELYSQKFYVAPPLPPDTAFYLLEF